MGWFSICEVRLREGGLPQKPLSTLDLALFLYVLEICPTWIRDFWSGLQGRSSRKPALEPQSGFHKLAEASAHTWPHQPHQGRAWHGTEHIVGPQEV